MEVRISSWPLRQYDRELDRKIFFANCWVMVEPPRILLRPRSACFWLYSQALRMASHSMPSWSVKLASSEATTARFRSEEHTSELQSLMRISYAVFCLKKKKQ